MTYYHHTLLTARRSFALSIILLFLIAGCKNDQEQSVKGTGRQLFKTEEFSKQLQALLPVPNDTASLHDLTNSMQDVYKRRNYKPVWITEEGIPKAAENFLRSLDSLQYEGISPARYNVATLQQQMGDIITGKLKGASACIAFDTAMTHAFLLAAHDLMFGMLLPKKADSLWFHSNDSTWIAVAMLSDSLRPEPVLSSFRSRIPTYHLLQQEYIRYSLLTRDKALKSAQQALAGDSTADSLIQFVVHRELPWVTTSTADSLDATGQYLRAFQQFNGLNPKAKRDTVTMRYLCRPADSMLPVLAANLERLRWLPQQLEDQCVIVNIPLMELFYRDKGVDKFHMRTVVGRPSRQTPVLNANMKNVVFNPPWGVPPTILKNDVLPGVSRSGSAYLRRKGLHAYNSHGKEVKVVNAKNLRGLSFRQPPGAHSSLGEVKFNMPNKWDIYLHDTPHREDFVKFYRAYSSGCVRVAQPKQFAEFILKELEQREFDPVVIDSIIQTRRTMFEELQTPIPVHMLYLTAFEDSTHQYVRFISDVYKKDKKLIALLPQ